MIIDFSLPQPLSNLYTHEQAVSEILVKTNTTDNEKIQLANVRNHLNIAIAYVVNLVGVSKIPKYGMHLTASLETTKHSTGLHWINLDDITYTSGFRPSQAMHSIKRVGAWKAKDYTALTGNAAAIWTSAPLAYDMGTIGYGARYEGNFSKRDLSALLQLNSNSNRNVQWNQSVCWSWEGNAIIIFVGNDIATSLQGTYATAIDDDAGNAYTLPFADISIYGERQPMLDDLLPESTSANYRSKVDLPDEYMNLAITLAQKSVLEQINADANTQMEVSQRINLELGKISQNLGEELQYEKAEREKIKYGDQR